MSKVWTEGQFRVLLAVVAAAGMTQGLLLPLLATLLEARGYSSNWNGVNAAALYLGILTAAPLCSRAVRRWGYRQVIGAGLGLTLVCTWLFPLVPGFYAWFVLRFLIGAGDSLLHYASQLWITTECPKSIRGRRISQYGLAYGLGFGLGPLGINLLPWGSWVPFVVMGLILSMIIPFVNVLDASRPHLGREEGAHKRKGFSVYRMAFIALCPAFLYGFLEASLSGSFPVYGLRQGLSPAWVSVLLTAFVYGSLLFQVPLGMLSDRWGRKQVLGSVCLLGTVGMAVVPFFMANAAALLVLFTLLGGLLGSLYSLGMAFMADQVPHRYLPEANAWANAHFAVGCMIGPYTGGWLIQYVGGGSLFWLIAGALLLFVLLLAVHRKEPLDLDAEAVTPELETAETAAM
ncbi:MFS transporter [Marinithermofilum abyssi]|uniref:MFS transporter n=1 Tax=Marinithermofilum abyssi TaxID=1571185 RepID=A0A8J2YA56_9BACL|nr:MFS transporter [Marinithermofilum abyssi]GGE06465.1 MFS transporter [Marinithermofilum abyssi]